MAKSSISLEPIQTLPGVQPVTDKTNVATKNYVYSDKIRYQNGFPLKIGGWLSQLFDYGESVKGTIRSIFTDFINGKFYTVLGSNEKLYSLIGSNLTNITPFLTTSVSVANSLETRYDTLSNNPFSSVNGSPVLTVTDSDSSRFQGGDLVYFSGATGFAGILAGAINGDQIVRSVGIGEYTVNVGINANATTSGGGSSVVRSSGLLTLTFAAHGQEGGDRVKISGAADTGGILASEINREFIIRNVVINSFDFMTVGEATSSVSSGGGASTIFYKEISDGALNEGNIIGYGAGMYGAGLYGTALVSTQARSYPRIWFMDRYADTIIMTPGNQGGVYQWQGGIDIAPALIPNAPLAVNYSFVSDNIIVTLGAGGIENRIFASDNIDITVWTSSSTNQVYDDDVEGAGRLISHCPVEDYNLIFTEYKTYTFRYIGLPFVWEIKALDESVGLISSMACVPVKGMAFWMSQNNFYMYRGGTVEVIPSNSQSESTMRNYVFNNLNWGQKSKIFAWYNRAYNEVWFHYPDAGSNEPNRVAVVNVLDFTWAPHTFDRTAAEYPSVKTKNPYLANENILFKHEIGTDANGSSMAWTITTNKRFYGKDNFNINAVIPDSSQGGIITFTDRGFLYPQSSVPTYTNNFSVIPSTDRIPVTSSARFHQYTWAGNQLGQVWSMGDWLEEVQRGAPE